MKITILRPLGLGLCYLAFAKALLITTSCKSESFSLQKVAASQTQIDNNLQSVAQIEAYIAPFKKSLDVQMDEQLSYNPIAMHKNDFKLNTPIGNMMAHIVRVQGAPIYKSRTGKDIDMVLLNHGGIRAAMPAGPVTMRRAYEIMPFDNQIVIVELTGEKVSEMVQYLVDRQRAHPLDGLKITIGKDDKLADVMINKASIDRNKTYTVATNDYLYTGGDDMSFFKEAPMTSLDYKIRNAMIDYFKKVDTLKFERDDRFDVIGNN